MKQKHTYLTFSAQSEPILLSEEKQISLIPHKVAGEAELYSDLQAYLDIRGEGLQSTFFKILLDPMHDADEFEEKIMPEDDEELINIEQWLSFKMQEQKGQASWDIEIRQDPEKQYLMMGFNQEDQFFWVFPSNSGKEDKEQRSDIILFSYDYNAYTLFPKTSFEDFQKSGIWHSFMGTRSWHQQHN